jgi:alpha-mannosidase
VDRPGVVIEAIERAEKENAVIVRLYEAHGTRGTVNLKISLPVSEACLADLMERSLDKVEIEGGNITLQIDPFEIITLKLKFLPG